MFAIDKAINTHHGYRLRTYNDFLRVLMIYRDNSVTNVQQTNSGNLEIEMYIRPLLK